MYASVLVEIAVKNVDREFVYKVPKYLEDKVKIGIRVRVSFANTYLEGFVISLSDKYEGDYELKEIIDIIDEEIILDEEMLELGKYLSEITLCSKISAYQVMLPKALKAQIKTDMKIKQNRYLVLNKEKKVIDDYISNCKFQDKILINKMTSSINTLLKKELVKVVYEEAYRYKYENDKKDNKVILNNEQKKVVDRVLECKNISKTFLLYGVTGSGKTEVYMHIIEEVLKDDKTAIMLVPEISLTPQIVNRFINRFGDNVAILHSGLSDSEKYDEYRKIKQGLVKIVVGARSAIFAPLKNIGVIVIDEEHTSSYKQDNNPRYHVKDIATFRSKKHNCPVVLGSATPSLESFARAGNNVYELLVIKNRAGLGKLPKVNIVDMKQEVEKGNFYLSDLLKRKIEEKLKKKEQVILLLNRRGYSSMLTCSNCGYVEKCPRCDISLTYHKTSNTLRCHYCNYSKKKQDVCPNCKQSNLKDFGLGTEKLEEELIKLFPSSRIVRMDADTTSRKGKHEQIITDFGNYQYDILLGTQMIAKGLDFPLVTLVGVINADMSLNVPDFRSSERTFQLLNQVSGRAGRSDMEGEVVIQTFNDNHYSIIFAKNHDYLSFYKEEMKIRKMLNYSPYYYITLVKITSKDYDLGFKESTKIGNYLKNNLSSETIVLGPSMCNMFKINNVFHYQCIIKYKKDEKLIPILTKIDEIYKTNNKINVEIDVEPTRL